MLGDRPEGVDLDYLAQFLSGVALSAHDTALRDAALALARDRILGRDPGLDVARISGLVRDRLAVGTPL